MLDAQGFILSFLLGTMPMVFFAVCITYFDRFEKEPLWLMVMVFIWGFLFASAIAYFVNTIFVIISYLFTGNEAVSYAMTAMFSAPIAEEALKGFALLVIFLSYRKELDSLLDGIIYGSLVGFGFAAAENFIYISNGYSQASFAGLGIMAFSRIILVPFLHAFLTSFTGIGIILAKRSRGIRRILFLFSGYLIAVMLHFIHNALATSGSVFLTLFALLLDWSGFAMMLIFLIYLVFREKRIMKEFLADEAGKTITAEQYDAACRIIRPVTKQKGLYGLCGELAFQKFNLRYNNDQASVQSIEELRKKLIKINNEKA